MLDRMPTVEGRLGSASPRDWHARGVWADDSLTGWLDHWADSEPGRRAVTDGVHDLNYGELRREAQAVAGWLRSRGVGAGDRVVVRLPNWSEFLSVYLGIARIGAETVPIMPVYRDD